MRYDPLLDTQSVMLTVVLANGGESANHRILSAQSGKNFQIAQRAHQSDDVNEKERENKLGW